jgi:TonB family protein
MNLSATISLFPILSTLAALTLSPVEARAAEPDATCSPAIVATRTVFPSHSQVRGEHGVVQVAIKLGSDGRAAETRLAKSSGFAQLDRAAVASVREHWRFNVARCDAQSLGLERVVEIAYRRAPQHTLSGTVNPKAAGESKRILAENRCHIDRSVSDTTVYACLQHSSVSVASAK